MIGAAIILTLLWQSKGLYADDLKVCMPELGCVQGTYMPGYQTVQFEAYLGIPFAKPPLGELRFKNPEPVQPWQDLLAVNRPKADCLQKNYLLDGWPISGEEDCLYLNVYRPSSVITKPLPVMFYIYGGGLFCGSAGPALMDPAYFMDTGEVIIVIPNYRLGPFGFLSTGTAEMPGNLGFKDQQLAMKWVQDNIAAFGGDPQAVTLFGHSAGASAVHLHTLSAASKGLFKNTIISSGNALGPYVSVINEPLQQTLKIAEAVGIAGAAELETNVLVEALQAIDPVELVNAGNALKIWHQHLLFNYRPTVEDEQWSNAFLTSDPKTLLEYGYMTQVPSLQSLIPNRGEGAAYTLSIWTHSQLLEEFNEQFDALLWQLLELPMDMEEEKRKTLLDMLVAEYLGGVHEVNNATFNGLSELFGDFGFYYPFWKSTKYFVANADVSSPPLYLSKLSYRGRDSRAFVYAGGSPYDYGVVHLDDLSYLFRAPAMFPVDFPKDAPCARMAKELVGFYVEFAKNSKVDGVEACNDASFRANGDTGICDFVEFLNHRGKGYEKVIHNEFNVKRMKLWEQIYENEV